MVLVLVVLLVIVVLYAACRSGSENFYATGAYDCLNKCPSGNCSYDPTTNECTDLSYDWSSYDLPSYWSNTYYSPWGRHYYNGAYRYGRWGNGGRWQNRSNNYGHNYSHNYGHNYSSNYSHSNTRRR
jgi:hypothetical protein